MKVCKLKVTPMLAPSGRGWVRMECGLQFPPEDAHRFTHHDEEVTCKKCLEKTALTAKAKAPTKL